MIRDLAVYGAPILRKSMLPVSNSDSHVQDVIRDLWDTLNYIDAAGLAANQISEPYNICVIALGHLTLINPVIVSGKGRFPSKEGCYSIPGYKAIVPRFKEIKVAAIYPLNLQPTLRIINDANLAVVIQHEVDHLGGIFIRDYVEQNFNRKGGVLISVYDADCQTAVNYKRQLESAKK